MVAIANSVSDCPTDAEFRELVNGIADALDPRTEVRPTCILGAQLNSSDTLSEVRTDAIYGGLPRLSDLQIQSNKSTSSKARPTREGYVEQSETNRSNRRCPCNDYNRCPICSRKRERAVTRNVESMLSGGDYWSLTLTVPTLPNSDLSLYRLLRQLLSDFKRLRRSSGWRGVTSGVYSVDVTYNALTGLYHPHLHILAEGQVDPRALSAPWGKLTGASARGVTVKAIDSAEYRRSMARYVAKAPNATFIADVAVNREFVRARERLRLKGTFGGFYGQPLVKRRGGRGRLAEVVDSGKTIF